MVMEFDIRIDALEEREGERERGETRWQYLPLPEKRGGGDKREGDKNFSPIFPTLGFIFERFPKGGFTCLLSHPLSPVLLHEIFRRDEFIESFHRFPSVELLDAYYILDRDCERETRKKSDR